MPVGRKNVVPLTALLPFLLLFTADDLTVYTQVEGDGSCLRKVQVTTPVATRYVRRRIEALVPGGDPRSGSFVRGRSLVLWRDGRYADANRLDGVELRVERSLFSPRVRYALTENLQIDFPRLTKKEQAAAPETTFQYRLRLPGTIDENSIQPALATIEGHTVTWKLSAGKEQYKITATSSALRYDYLALAIWIMLAAVWVVVRLILQHRFRVPATI